MGNVIWLLLSRHCLRTSDHAPFDFAVGRVFRARLFRGHVNGMVIMLTAAPMVMERPPPPHTHTSFAHPFSLFYLSTQSNPAQISNGLFMTIELLTRHLDTLIVSPLAVQPTNRIFSNQGVIFGDPT